MSSKSFFKKVYSIICLTIIFCIKNSGAISAKAVIVPLKDDLKLLEELKEYKVHQELCDKYSDRYVAIKNIEYYDFNGNIIDNGVIVVQDTVADSVVRIFEELKDKKFPIAPINPRMGRKMTNGFFGKTVEMNEEYADNFTGAYSCRNIEYTKNLSAHALGTAIDLNFLQNPCIFIDEEKQEVKSVVPKAGVMYLNRKLERPNKPYGYGKIDYSIVKIFQKNGFDIWGGNWDNPIDYQHFQVSSRKFAELLINIDKNDAKRIFNKHIQCFNKNKRSLNDLADDAKISLQEIYYNDTSKDKKNFFKFVDNICHLTDARQKQQR